ncbi:MAG: hypothetical protein QOJ09_3076, partial [Actinomycetota bacterium]|nr:hypothetical protein [Actinomycetota bacterium]
MTDMAAPTVRAAEPEQRIAAPARERGVTTQLGPVLASMVTLQRTAGNLAVQRLVSPPPAKPGDVHQAAQDLIGWLGSGGSPTTKAESILTTMLNQKGHSKELKDEYNKDGRDLIKDLDKLS